MLQSFINREIYKSIGNYQYKILNISQQNDIYTIELIYLKCGFFIRKILIIDIINTSNVNSLKNGQNSEVKDVNIDKFPEVKNVNIDKFPEVTFKVDNLSTLPTVWLEYVDPNSADKNDPNILKSDDISVTKTSEDMLSFEYPSDFTTQRPVYMGIKYTNMYGNKFSLSPVYTFN